MKPDIEIHLNNYLRRTPGCKGCKRRHLMMKIKMAELQGKTTEEIKQLIDRG